MSTLALSPESQYIAGVVLLTIVTIEFGGWFVSRIVRGDVPMTDFQRAFARAMHGHAGMLVTLSLVCLILADAAAVDGAFGWVARLGVPVAAVLMPLGFYLSSAGRDVTRPNGMIAVVWLGAAILALGVVTLGIGLLIA
ncbi:hypothetical protein ACOQFL_17720 [Actinopolyspora sp. H202]|uniref:hypothetical protein n=1 Tax=Actinopolyspora sp. H202 TaxID=1500456 RepID=UPI003EE5E924